MVQGRKKRAIDGLWEWTKITMSPLCQGKKKEKEDTIFIV